MSFVRPCVYQEGMERPARVEGWLSSPLITTNAAAGNQNITVAMIAGGAGLFTGAAGAVNLTLPTTALILAALPDMDIGDTYVFSITNTAAQAATFVAGDASTTLAGFGTTNANTRWCVLQRTGAATVTVTVL